jgi:tetratricopeptide (TPR) repeat protein
MMLRRTGKYGAILAAMLTLTVAAFAGPVEDARQAFRSGDYTAAARLAEQATKEEPNNSTAYTLLGSSRAKLGDKAGAREAWGKVLALDPDLSTINDKQGFLKAYKQLGGNPPSDGKSGEASGENGTAIIRALTEDNYYVAPALRHQVHGDALHHASNAQTKLVALTTVYPYRSPNEMAAKLRQSLNLGEGVVVVATPKRVGASSGRLSSDQIDKALAEANLDQAYAQGGLTSALVYAGQAVNREVVSVRRTEIGIGGGIAFLAIAGVGGFLVVNAVRKKKAMADAREPIVKAHRQVLDNLSYVDNYLDLLPAGAESERARSLRAAAYEKYAVAGEILKTAKTPDEVRKAEPLLRNALSEMEECRVAIDKATGGTGVAMSLPTIPSLDTDAEKARIHLKAVEEIQSEQERDRFQREVEAIPEDQRGVSFFSGRPAPASELVPVTIVIQGQKRTVLATREEAAAIARGETPSVRAFDDGSGNYVPWYANRNYDPYRDYYSGWGYGGSSIGTLVDLYVLTHVFGGGMWGGWGGWGYGVPYGGPPVIIDNNHYGAGYGGYDNGNYSGSDNTPAADAPVEHAGGFEFFGQQDYNDTAPDTSWSNNDSGGSFDSGSTDFGGGDFSSSSSDFGGGDFSGGSSGGDW